MELDDLRQRWQAGDVALDSALHIKSRAVGALSSARDALGRLTLQLRIEIGVGAVLLLLTGSFAADHVNERATVVCGIGAGAWLVLAIAFAARQLVELRKLDWTQPVVALQTRLERVRMLRIRMVQVLLFTGIALWAPAFLLVLRALGVDVFAVVSTPWLASNVAFGIVLAVAALVASVRYGVRVGGAGLIPRAVRGLAGSGLNSAAAFVESLRAEQEARA